MTKLIFVMVLVFGFSHVHAAGTLKTEIDLLKCVRKTINNKRVDGPALEKLNNLLNEYNRSNAAELATRCETLKKEFKKLPRISFDKMWDIFSYQNLEGKGSYILRDNIDASMHCKMGGIQADAALGIGFGLGLGVGRCQSTDGRIWGMFIPTASMYFGGGATVEAIHGEFYIYRGKPVFDSTLEINLGFIFAQKEGDDIDGEGIGFGLMIGGTTGLALKVLPIGNNFERGLENLGALN